MSELTELIRQASSGDAEANGKLFTAAYSELRKLARSKLHSRDRNTVLDTTALVHESYLSFIRIGELKFEDRRAFFGYCSKVMRSVILDLVKERRAARRGGGGSKLTLDTQTSAHLGSNEQEILKVHEALLALEAVEPRLARVVEMRYFGGYSEAEIADTLKVSERTVVRDWDKARLLLKMLMKD